MQYELCGAGTQHIIGVVLMRGFHQTNVILDLVLWGRWFNIEEMMPPVGYM